MDVVLKKKKYIYFLFKSLFKVQITSNDNFFFFLKEEKKSFGYFNSRKKKN